MLGNGLPLPMLNQRNYASSGSAGYDVILVAGQSNNVGYGSPISNPTDQGNSRTLQFAQHAPSLNTVIQANEPLLHPDGYGVTNSTIGYAVAFAKLYAASISSRRSVLLVPSSTGGTGFNDNHWNPGNDLFTAAVTATNAAITQGSGVNRFVGILWLQGELDALQNVTTNEYAFKLDRMISAFRSQITGASDSWFVLGQMNPDYVATLANYQLIDTAHQNTPLRNLRTAFWFGATGAGVNLHYDAVRQRLNGPLAFAALGNLSISTVLPGQPTNLAVAAVSGSSADLTWTSPSTGALAIDYLVEYRVSPAGSWTTFAHPSGRIATPSVTVYGLSQSTAYDFRVSAVSTPGTGPASATATGTTTTSPNVAFDGVTYGPTTVLSNNLKDINAISTGPWTSARSNTAKASGKWYVEFKSVQYSGAPHMEVGLADASWAIATKTYLGDGGPSIGAGNFGGGIWNAVGFTSSGPSIPSVAVNDIFGIAVDVGAKKAWISKNGVWLQGDPVAGTSASITWSGSYTIHAAATSNAATEKLRIDSASLTYGPPSGYSAWT